MIRRKKTTIFTDAKDNTTVEELKKMIEGNALWRQAITIGWNTCIDDENTHFTGILKVKPADQLLFSKNEVMKDDKQLQDYGITISAARAQSPAQLGLALR